MEYGAGWKDARRPENTVTLRCRNPIGARSERTDSRRVHEPCIKFEFGRNERGESPAAEGAVSIWTVSASGLVCDGQTKRRL